MFAQLLVTAFTLVAADAYGNNPYGQPSPAALPDAAPAANYGNAAYGTPSSTALPIAAPTATPTDGCEELPVLATTPGSDYPTGAPTDSSQAAPTDAGYAQGTAAPIVTSDSETIKFSAALVAAALVLYV
jgi:hypothetical protein